MSERYKKLRESALKGGTRYLPKLREQNKLTARERLDLLLDPGSFVEDGLFANVLADELPADGVITGLGAIEGRHVAVMANDPTVKAGSWGARMVGKEGGSEEALVWVDEELIDLAHASGAYMTDRSDENPVRRQAEAPRVNAKH